MWEHCGVRCRGSFRARDAGTRARPCGEPPLALDAVRATRVDDTRPSAVRSTAHCSVPQNAAVFASQRTAGAGGPSRAMSSGTSVRITSVGRSAPVATASSAEAVASSLAGYVSRGGGASCYNSSICFESRGVSTMSRLRSGCCNSWSSGVLQAGGSARTPTRAGAASVGISKPSTAWSS